MPVIGRSNAVVCSSYGDHMQVICSRSGRSHLLFIWGMWYVWNVVIGGSHPGLMCGLLAFCIPGNGSIVHHQDVSIGAAPGVWISSIVGITLGSESAGLAPTKAKTPGRGTRPDISYSVNTVAKFCQILPRSHQSCEKNPQISERNSEGFMWVIWGWNGGVCRWYVVL